MSGILKRFTVVAEIRVHHFDCRSYWPIIELASPMQEILFAKKDENPPILVLHSSWYAETRVTGAKKPRSSRS
jgi:hypothetical protein